MGRNKKKIEDKNESFGISLDPKIVQLLKEQSEKENITLSKLVQNVMKEHFKKETNNND